MFGGPAMLVETSGPGFRINLLGIQAMTRATFSIWRTRLPV